MRCQLNEACRFIAGLALLFKKLSVVHSLCAAGVYLTVFLSAFSYAQTNLELNDVYVRTLKSRHSVALNGFAIRFLNDENQLQSEILPRKYRYIINREKNGWLVTDTKQMQNHRFYEGDTLQVSGEMLKLDDLASADTLILRSKNEYKKEERFEVIAKLPIEEYLKGVLPSEMPVAWPLESLKAQAVAARTYVLNIMRSRVKDGGFAKDGYHLDNTINHQVFQMQNFVGASSSAREKVLQALQETQGVYLVDKNGEPYKTYFHSDCGGQTEEPQDVWGSGPHNGTVKEEQCQLNPYSKWSYEISREELEKKIAATFDFKNVPAIQDIVVASKTGSGRIHELLFYFSDKEKSFRALNAQEFRRIFGFNNVKSTNFSFIYSHNGMSLNGRGHGHGAGLCQKGARFMAMAGSKYSDILKRYYPTTTFAR